MRLAPIFVMVFTATLHSSVLAASAMENSDKALIAAPAGAGLDPDVQRRLRGAVKEDVGKDEPTKSSKKLPLDEIIQQVMKSMPMDDKTRAKLETFLRLPENKNQIERMVDQTLQNPEKLKPLIEKLEQSSKTSATRADNTP